MSKNLLVISVDVRETRVALIEDGIIAELHIERRNNPFAGTVGNVYLGKVTRVLPGLQAAFIDIGQERAAFLHVEDLIRPDDFEAYLAGGHRHEGSETFKGDGGKRFGQAKAKPVEKEVDDEDDDDSDPSAAAPPEALSQVANPISEAPADEDDDDDDDD